MVSSSLLSPVTAVSKLQQLQVETGESTYGTIYMINTNTWQAAARTVRYPPPPPFVGPHVLPPKLTPRPSYCCCGCDCGASSIQFKTNLRCHYDALPFVFRTALISIDVVLVVAVVVVVKSESYQNISSMVVLRSNDLPCSRESRAPPVTSLLRHQPTRGTAQGLRRQPRGF